MARLAIISRSGACRYRRAKQIVRELTSANTAKIMETLVGLQASRGMTLIIVTHEDSIAESAPRHIRMRDGRIVA